MKKIETLNETLSDFFLDEHENRLETDPLSLNGMSQPTDIFCFINRNPEEYGFCGFNFSGDSVAMCIFNFCNDDIQQEQETILESETDYNIDNQKDSESTIE